MTETIKITTRCPACGKEWPLEVEIEGIYWADEALCEAAAWTFCSVACHDQYHEDNGYQKLSVDKTS